MTCKRSLQKTNLKKK